MIYTFTWNSDFLISEEVKRWKKGFIEKHSEFNIIYVKENEEIDINALKENILVEDIFGEKKLIIIEKRDTEDKKNKKDDFWEDLLKILENKSENNIVVFSYFSPDKRKKFYKNIIKISKEVKEFNLDENSIRDYLLSKYAWKIDAAAINLLIFYKSNNIRKIISEIEKLLILKNFIKREDIEKNIFPEIEEDFFEIINLILNKEKKLVVQKIRTKLEQVDIFSFYNGILANLRINIFILKLKKEKLSKQKINEILNLWNRAFLIDKTYKINFSEAKKLYENLVKIDKDMKTWKLLDSDEESIRFEIEKCILKI